jgi:hypothetical protein
MAMAVVEGAQLICTLGDQLSQLKVTSQQTVKIDSKLAATVEDTCAITNIPIFGTCKALTAAASGTPTPCALVPAGPWTPGSMSRVVIGKSPALLSTDTLKCTAAPGEITITDPGQKDTQDT